ncbi:MAG TPA: uroporphyrinogen-III synthase [Candidatus Binatia bacterium]
MKDPNGQEQATQTASLHMPLAGKRVVITRARKQAESLARSIEKLGGAVTEFPTIEICPPESFAEFDAAIDKLDTYDWVIFTSINSVEPFLSRLQLKGKDIAALSAHKIGAIGAETAKQLERVRIHASLVPERYQAEGILDALSPEEIRGKRVLIPRAAEAREILPATLRKWGAAVDVIVAYRTNVPCVDVRPLAVLLTERKIDVITFTSSSTVRNFVRLFGGRNLGEIVSGSAIACIGPITAATVEELGGRAEIVADQFTATDMLRAIVEHFEANSRAVV